MSYSFCKQLNKNKTTSEVGCNYPILNNNFVMFLKIKIKTNRNLNTFIVCQYPVQPCIMGYSAGIVGPLSCVL